MRLLSNLHVKGKPAVLPDRAIRRQSHYFIYRPCIYVTLNTSTIGRTCQAADTASFFVSRLCKRRADDLFKLNKHQLKSAVAFLTGHAPVRRHLRTIGLFNEDPSCRFCRMETETAQHIICSCEALSRQRYNIFGKPLVQPREISTASFRDLCLFIRVSGLLNLCWNT
jgi:hypothetical protein